MAEQKNVICDFCGSGNRAGVATCFACGAPVHRGHVVLVDLNPKVTTIPPEKSTEITNDDVRLAAETTSKVYRTAMDVYATIWRTVSEALAIAVSATIIGAVGGASTMQVWGVLGGMIVGLAVGMSVKWWWKTLISAPAGTIVGLLLSAIFFFLGWNLLPVFIVTGTSVIGAMFGSPSWRSRKKNVWERVRPVLGLVGGGFFGLIGMLVSWGIVEGARSLFS